MKSRLKKRKIRFSDARNTRLVSYKYFPVDDAKSQAFAAGRCYICRRITTDFCFGCSRFVCESHSERKADEVWCNRCIKKGIRRNPQLTYIG